MNGGGPVVVTMGGGGCGGSVAKKAKRDPDEEEADDDEQSQLSLVDLLVTALRKSMASCRVERGDEVEPPRERCRPRGMMEIGLPTDVRHVTHVTFDRFNGFLGLPVEFEVEIPCRVPSARFDEATKKSSPTPPPSPSFPLVDL